MAKTKDETTMTAPAQTQASTSTGLAIIPASQFTALQQDRNDMKLAMQSLAETGEALGPGDLNRVPMPTGGGTTWEIPSLSGKPEKTEEITGILVFYCRSGLLWPTLEMQEGSIPVLRTLDLETAEQIGPIPPDMAELLETVRIDERTFWWSEKPGEYHGKRYPGNPYNQWGTGKDGVGKRCKEQRLMFLLREGDLFPLLIVCQPGSLRPVTQFVKQFVFQGLQYWGAIVSLSLQKMTNEGNKPYSQIVPKLVGRLSAEDAANVKAIWTEPLGMMVQHIKPELDPTIAREPGEEG